MVQFRTGHPFRWVFRVSVFVLWVAEGERRIKQVLLSSAAFAAMTGFALLIDPPYGGYKTIVFDHISLAFVILASLPLVVGLASLPLRLITWRPRFIFLVLAGAMTSGLWLLCFPSAFGGVEGAMDPYVAKEWLASINEVHPLKGWREILIYLGAGALCLPLIPVVARKNYQRVALLILLVGLGALGETHYRFSGYIIIAAAFFLGTAFDKTRISSRRWIRLIAVSFATLLFLEAFAGEVLSDVFYVDLENRGGEDDGYNCDPYDVKDLLNDPNFMDSKIAAPIVADDINATPMLLYWTDLRTLAGKLSPRQPGH